MKNHVLSLIIAIGFIGFISCDNLKNKQADAFVNGFSEYVQAHTNGFIASDEQIVVVLKQSLTGYKSGDQLPDDIFDFSPNLKGKAFLVEGNSIQFYPDNPMGNGESYEVTFRIGDLLNMPDELDELSFEFQVLPLDFTVLKGQLETTEGSYSFRGKIQCSDHIDSDELKSVFNLSGSGGLEFEITQLKPKIYEYTISGITKMDDPSSITLEWNARKIDVDEKGELVIDIPGKDEFIVLGVYPQQGENQRIRLVFSDELAQSQDLSGLIYLSGDSDVNIQVRGQEVVLYPTSRLEGEWDLIIEKSVKSKNGKNLLEPEKYSLVMSPLPPEIEFIGKGYILPNANGLLLPFRAVSLRGVDLYVYRIYANNVQQFLQRHQPQEEYSLGGSLKYVGRPVFRKTIRLDQDASLDLSQWNSFTIDLSKLVNDDPHALYHIELRMRKTLASFVCDGANMQADNPIDLLPEDFDDEALAGFNDSEYYYEDLYPEDYSWRDRDNPCSDSYYIPRRFKYKNVLATNLGVLAKSGNQKDFMVVVTDLLSAEPVSNASVQFYNFQQQQILASMTDPDGMSQVKLDEVPYLIEVQKGNQKAFLRVDDGTSLSLSNFDVAGTHVEEGIKGYIYGERGVWRPGDTLHLSFALFDKQGDLPDDLPVIMEVYNAMDHLVYKSSSTKYLNDLYAFSVPTNPDDPTGNWRAVVKVGGISFGKTLKVENIRPNRLKMELDFNRTPLMPRDRQQYLDFSSSWLHGAPAANMRAEVRVKLLDQKTAFEGYERYTFTNPLKQYWPDDIMIYDDLLDNQGERTLPVYLDIGHYSPGMLKAVFTSRVYEKGGGFSTDVYSMPFSPYKRYVGISIPELSSPRDQLVTDSLHKVDVVTLSSEGKPLSVNYLQARVYKIRWSWWWSSQQDDLASYIGSRNEKLVYETVVSTSNGKGSFSFKVDYPDWGRYLVHVFDPESEHGSGQSVYMDWPAWANRDGRANPSGATMLTFTADKEEYEPGKKAILTFPSVEDARALLTLEAGEEIVYSKWIKTDAGETEVAVEMTDEMAPNVYASISMIQTHEHDDNDLPIRQYGVLRLNVNNPESKLEPEIEMPEEIRPSSEYTVKVSEAHGNPMTYTLAIVDEGLLNLTRFKTPDPWSDFYATEALGMKTWDMYDDVIGAYGGRIESLLAIGGDEGEIQNDAKKANRFTPVVTFLGPFELKKNRSEKHNISMPNYVGEVRAMVIAGDATAWGSAEAKAFVRQPLMVLSALPRKLSPGEKVDLPISVFVMKEGLSEAKVTVSTEGPVQCIGENEVTISAAQLGEQMVFFPLETTDITGIGRIIVEVQSGNEKAQHITEIQVLNPNPYVYKTINYVLEEGEEIDVPVKFHGSAGTNSSSITVSGLPSFNLEENLQYLIKYPYGCLEQISSSAFVQLMLDQLSDLNDNQKLEADNNIRATIRKISNFQLPSGGMSLWPGTSGANLWAGSYAGHFLLLAEQKGYVIPGLVKDKWLKFQKARVNSYSSRSDYQGDSDLQQAYRLYTLALANQPDLSAMNRLKESARLNKAVAWRLAAAYAISGKDEVALQLITHSSADEFQTQENSFTFGSSLRDQAMMLETLILLDKKTEAFSLARKLIDGLKSMRWSTQTTAYSMLALAQLSGQSGEDEMLKFSIKDGAETEKINTQKLAWLLNLDESKADQSISVVNRNSRPLFVEYTAYGQSAEGISSASSDGLDLDYRFTDMLGEIIDPTELKQGTSFYGEVWIQNPAQNGELQNLALSQAFPSGWEIISTRYAEDDSGSNTNTNAREESSYTYRDIKDDRVYTFFSLSAGAKAIFKIKLNAAYAGEFVMPAITVEAMYQPQIHANSANSHVEVIGNR